MSKKTYLYSILLCSSLLFLCLSPASAQAPQQKKIVKNSKKLAERKERERRLADTIPLFNGVYVGIDIYGIGASLFGSDTKSTEVQVDVNLKNRFFPVMEIGFADTESESEHGTYYTSKGPYFRVGLNYKMKYRNTSESHLYVGARYAFSPFKYNVESLTMTDDVWGTPPSTPNLGDDIWGGSVPFRIQDESTSAHWAELVFGLRAQVWKNFMMGWSVRLKQRLGVGKGDQSEPAFIPGFGENKTTTLGVTYSLIYKLPF